MEKEKKNTPNNLKNFLMVAVIIILYTPMIFLFVNTIFEMPENSYSACKYPNYVGVNKTSEEMQLKEQEYQECMDEQNAKRDVVTTNRFLTITGISVFVLILLISLGNHFKKPIIYGLFGGVSLSMFINLMTMIDNKSLIGVISAIILFVLVLIFVNKKSQD
jgi:magnesium-transporting ATPase (P-type)